ncbi:MAG: hypothetical protein AB7I30_01575 [Isosphaeraceae bacterium]
MSISLTGMIRLIGLLAVSSCAVAIAMARLEPEPWRLRLGGPPAHGVLNGFLMEPAPGVSQFLDPETGRVSPLNLPTTDRIDYGACSPWSDEEGEYQLVGRWERREARNGGIVSLAFGLARYAMPGGRMLDQLPLEVPPASHPCWFPDRTARVLYAGGDGRLYRIAFEGPEISAGLSPTPRPIVWKVPAPGAVVLIRDPVWSTAAALDGRLIVSLAYQVKGGDEHLRAARLWWLRLDPSGSAIVGAGPLESESGTIAGQFDDERYPTVAVTPDGSLMLAWLTHRVSQWRWELELAPVRWDPSTGDPRVGTSETRTLSRDPMPSLSSFSVDGQYLCTLVGVPGRLPPPRVVRFATGTDRGDRKAPAPPTLEEPTEGG